MLYLISGGSGSGKSQYAEKLSVDRNKYYKGNLFYVATMYPYDDESYKRIEKHQEMRKDKGFETIECYSNIGKINVNENDVILIECMSNLLANEMYIDEGKIKGKNLLYKAEKEIVKPISDIAKKAGAVIVVTNEVFSDGLSYDIETQKYIELLGFINKELSKYAKNVTEVVCSIPVCVKGELPC